MSAAPGRIFVTGASGLVGEPLCAALLARGHEVVALSRRARAAAGGMRWLRGDPAEPGAWGQAIDGAQAVFHLAGEPVASGRWTAARKRRLVSSRVASGECIVAAIAAAARPPHVLVSASASGYYGPRGEEELCEDAEPGHDFLARLCVDWEAAAARAAEHAVRVVSLRFGVVLSRRGGALARMSTAFRLGLGGPLGPGERFFPWIHEDDALGLALLALEGGDGSAEPIRGALNVVAPEAVRMREFAAALGSALKRPALLPLPLPLLRLALGEAAEGLVPGQRIVPRRALERGYAFRFPKLAAALAALVG